MTHRVPLIAGNWKMHKTVPEAVALALELRRALEGTREVEVMVLPPFVSLWAVAEALRGSAIRVGAQNAWYGDSGAFTGEISPAMLAGWCDAVLLGHSERRQYAGETDALINRKLNAVLAHGLRVILAVGETLSEYERQRTEEVVRGQLGAALKGVTPPSADHLTVAYEPVWAIGTGRAASAAYANQTIGLIRRILKKEFGDSTSERMRVLYGGSMNAKNTGELLAQPEIDGGLVGGASLIAAEFAEMVRLAAAAKAVVR
jgi:triosephosphate isomerase